MAPVVIPVYGQRRAWRPKAIEDFGDGGAYPECHVAQYPLEMGRKNKVRLMRCIDDDCFGAVVDAICLCDLEAEQEGV